MDEETMSRKQMHGEMEGRRRGRPSKRWLQDSEEDLRVIQVGKWWEKEQSEEEWRRIVREATPGSNIEEEELTSLSVFLIIQRRTKG
jgi:phage terminase small subunit